MYFGLNFLVNNVHLPLALYYKRDIRLVASMTGDMNRLIGKTTKNARISK